jgi:hypothetical protein
MNLVDRAKNMILTPKTEWFVVDAETPDPPKILTGYIIPLVLLGAAAAFIGYGLIGFSMFGVKIAGINWGIYYAVNQIVMGIASVYITAFVVDALAPSFGSEKNFGKSFQLVAYGATPSLLAGIFAILPMLATIAGLAAIIYTVYIWYLGIGPLKRTPEDKRVVYLVIIFIVLIVVYAIIGAIFSRLLMPAFGLSFGSPLGM